MEAVIRPAKAADSHAICLLNKLSLGYDHDEAETARQLQAILLLPSDRLFVAEVNGEAVGYIHGSAYECTYAPSMKNILALCILPDYQGKGIGSKLIKSLEQWAAEDGCAGVRLVSGNDRVGAHKFYAACGYTMRKEQKNFVKLF